MKLDAKKQWIWMAAALLVGLGACGGDNGGSAGPVADYARVTEILGGPEQGDDLGACAASVCHGGDRDGEAGLNFKKAKTLHEALVNVPACENSSMMRVKPGDLEHSWLWIKLNADIQGPADFRIKFDGTPSDCPGVSNGFGERMPKGSASKLEADDLATVKAWIEAGAPAK